MRRKHVESHAGSKGLTERRQEFSGEKKGKRHGRTREGWMAQGTYSVGEIGDGRKIRGEFDKIHCRISALDGRRILRPENNMQVRLRGVSDPSAS
eukprot:950366-Rhodomonas_salina.1